MGGTSAGPRPDAPAVDPAFFMCPEVPVAYVLDSADPFTRLPGEAGLLLAQAGFEVRPLPLDQNPAHLKGLIFFSSFVSETAAYRDYVVKNATNLYTFVDKGNVLVQMSQADQTEPAPPFLPSTHRAQRQDQDLGKLFVVRPDHALALGLPTDQTRHLLWQFPQAGWDIFASQGGFEVVLAENAAAENPVLIEGAYGQGRFVLSAMALDKPITPGPIRDRLAAAFFQNLLVHVGEVCRRRAPAVQVTASVGNAAFSSGSFTLAVLPDTQVYSLLYPGVFMAQTSWIAGNAQRRQIPYVFHLGDVVNNNTHLEWQRAAHAMWLLEGIVPYALAPGNHDYGPSGDASTRETLLNDYFPYELISRWPTFGGAFESGRLDNTFHLFSAGGRDFIVLALEWGPREEVITWARTVMDAHPGRLGILVTHAYLHQDGRRFDIADPARAQDFNPHFYGTAGGVNDGEQLWQKLVRRYPFILVFTGHSLGDGNGYLASVTDVGTTCHQMLSNYQFRELGGEGYMRLLEFLADGQTVRVYTYSPLYDAILADPTQTFDISLGLPPPAAAAP